MSKLIRLRLIILFVLFLAALILVYAAFKEERGGILTVAFLDIGQGDAIFIEAPNGNQVLIDGGPGKSVLRELGQVMPFYDRSIDIVLATHADSDHIGGLPDVLSKYEVGLFLESGVAGESSAYGQLERQITERSKEGGMERLEARRGMVVDLGRGAILQILFPDRDPEGMETNTASIIARLVYGESEFLFTGDSPTAIERHLVTVEGGREGLRSDVLKVGHHGSKTSTSAEFVAAVSPQYAVISAGQNNRYGHPNKEVLDILNSFGATVLRTDESGRIIFKSDGRQLSTLADS